VRKGQAQKEVAPAEPGISPIQTDALVPTDGHFTRVLLGACLAAICLLALAVPAQANFVVNNLGDGSDFAIDGTCEVTTGMGDCTLRAAVQESNNTAALDNITFSVSGTHNITDVLAVSEPVSITGQGSGAGAGNTIIDGGDATRLLSFTGSTGELSTLTAMRLQNGGVLAAGALGAGILTGTDLTLSNVVVTSNLTSGTGNAEGAGIRSSDSDDTLTVQDSVISANSLNNTAQNFGAGISALGALNLIRTTVSGNMINSGTAVGGGGVYAQGPLSIDRSTLSGNSVPSAMFGSNGGGLLTGNTGTKTIVNSTFSGNFAQLGGAVDVEANLSITNVTFSDNVAGAVGDDLYAAAGTSTLKNTILNSTPNSCASGGGMIASAIPGNNIDVGTTCGLGTTNGNRENTNPLLAALAFNAPGSTQTHALMPTSPAIDTATPDCGGISTDQRGVSRPQPTGGICDVGSYEVPQVRLAVVVNGSGTVTGTGINCPGDCSQGFQTGGMFTLTATPTAGQSFLNWVGCDSPVGNQCTQTLVSADETVTANFSSLPAPTGGGGTTPPPPSKKKKCKKKKRSAASAKKCKKSKK
jgi:hypothetical protein